MSERVRRIPLWSVHRGPAAEPQTGSPGGALRRLRRHRVPFALGLAILLLIAEIIVQPSFAEPANWAGELAVFAPFAIVAMASTPAVVSGGGGIDLSIGPLATVANCVFVSWLLPHGLGGPVSVPILLAIGAAVGAVNGVLVARFRYQPVVATLCMFFVLVGVAAKISANPATLSANWTVHLAQSIGFFPGALLTIAFPLVLWGLLGLTSFHRTLYAVGGDDASAYSAGIGVVRVRILAYTLGGLFAAVGGIALTALIQTSSASLSTQYALIALAGVALGGTPIGGGRGGMVGSLLGAMCIYLIQQLLSSTGVSANYQQLVYGALLITGVMLSMRYPRGVRLWNSAT